MVHAERETRVSGRAATWGALSGAALLCACGPADSVATPPVVDDDRRLAPLARPDNGPVADPIVLASIHALTDGVHEATHLAAIDSEHALVVARRGFAVTRRDGGGLVAATYDATSLSRVAVAGDRAWGVTSTAELAVIDLSDLGAPWLAEAWEGWETRPRDVAVADGVVVLSLPQEDRILGLDSSTGERLWSLDLTEPGVLAVDSGTLVVATGRALTWLDWAADQAPTPAAETALGAVAHDLDLVDGRLAVALGGLGVVVLDQDDPSRTHDPVPLPAASYGVALAGERLWAAAWDQVALLALDTGTPVLSALEPAASLATAVLAGGDQLVVADWSHVSTLTARDGVAAPELSLPTEVWVSADGPAQVEVVLENHGRAPLVVDLAPLDTLGWTSSPTGTVLAAGASQTLVLEGQEGARDGELSWTSNDPDEPAGTLRIRTSTTGLGTEHHALTLPGFTWPDATLVPLDLAEQRGSVVALAYFNLW